jgi:hypothetical protein
MHRNHGTSGSPAGLLATLLAALLVAAAVAGCGGSTTPATGGGGAATPGTEVGSPDEGSQESAASGEPAEATGAAEEPAAGGAESQISESGVIMPKQIGTGAYTSYEYRDDQLAMFLPFKSDDLDAVLDAQGKTRVDVLLVVAAPDDMAYPVVTAVRIDGGEAQPLADAVAAGSLGDLDWATADMDGKSVATAKGALGTFILYAKGDTMYLVNGNGAEALDAVVGLLP